MLHRMYQKLAVEGIPFSVCDLITEEMVVLVMFMIFPALRGEHQHKRDIDTIIVVGLGTSDSFTLAELCNNREATAGQQTYL